MGATFDLVEQPWIPVARKGGREVTYLSLLDALVHAREIERLAPEAPTMMPAILRQVLLPTAADALDFPEDEQEWGERWRQGRFDVALIERYLDEHSDRFDLFHPTAPFAQAGDLRTGKGQFFSSKLLLPSGTNIPLFSSSTDADVLTLPPPRALLWLLHVLCWDTAGIKTGAVGDPQATGGKAYGNPVGPLGQLGVVVPTGRNLFETLMLNLPIWAGGRESDDLPHWRRAPLDAVWETRAPTGPLDLFTWMSRRVRLVPEVDEQGKTVVRQVLVAAGDRLRSIPDYEPHTTWAVVSKPKPDDPPWRPRRHRLGQEMWQGLPALLAVPAALRESGDQADVASSGALSQVASLQENDELDDDYPLGVYATGIVYGTQSAIVTHVISDSIPLPLASLKAGTPVRDLVERLAADVDALARAVNILDDDLRRAAGGEPTPWDKGQRPGTVVIHQLDSVTRRLLAGLQQEPDRVDEAERAWTDAARTVVEGVAEQLLAAVPPDAFVGRDVNGRQRRVATAELAFQGRVRQQLGARHRDEEGQASETELPEVMS